MKAVVVYQAGTSNQLKVENIAIPNVKPGWSLIKVKAFGVNRSEIFTREGKSPSVTFPRVLGIECVGVVEKTSAPHLLPVGQKIMSIMGEMGRAFDGSYAEYVLLPNDQIFPIESDLPWETLATIPETYYTAFGSLNNLQVSEDDRILVRGGTSGVGVAFVKLLRGQYPQNSVDGTSRHESKRGLLLSNGYDDVVIEENGQLQTKKTYDKILELIGPATIKNSFKHLSEGGILCSTGQLGGQWFLEEFDPIVDIKQNSYFTSFYSGNVNIEKMNELLSYIQNFRIDIKPEKVFKLDEIKLAHDYLDSRDSFGKVIVTL